MKTAEKFVINEMKETGSVHIFGYKMDSTFVKELLDGGLKVVNDGLGYADVVINPDYVPYGNFPQYN